MFLKLGSIVLKLSKGGFFPESAIPFLNLQNKNIPNYYPDLEIWICYLLLLVGNLNFKFKIVIWNIFFLRFEKHIALSEEMKPLTQAHVMWKGIWGMGYIQHLIALSLISSKFIQYSNFLVHIFSQTGIHEINYLLQIGILTKIICSAVKGTL